MVFDGVLNIKDQYLVVGTLTVIWMSYLDDSYLDELFRYIMQLYILPANDIY